MSREVIIQRIEKSDLIDAKKELMIDLVNSKKEDNFDKKVDRLYRQFSKSSTFKKHAEIMVLRDDEKLKICNMMLVMSVTLTLFFLKAVLFSSYVVNFSVDAIVGCAALVFSLINVRTKYRTLRRYDLVRDFVYLDVLSLILCILFKMFFPVQVDFSLIILFIVLLNTSVTFKSNTIPIRSLDISKIDIVIKSHSSNSSLSLGEMSHNLVHLL